MSGQSPKRRATYQDVIDAPEHKVAEIIGGELHLSPRPGVAALVASAGVMTQLYQAFKRPGAEPGGWIILHEPELHFGDDVVVPNLAGWRRTRMPHVPDVEYFTLAPDWIYEALEPATEKLDRAEKLPLYARVGVQHAWLGHARRHTLEALRLHAGYWLLDAVHKDDERARIAPFDAIELELPLLWADVERPRGDYEHA